MYNKIMKKIILDKSMIDKMILFYQSGDNITSIVNKLQLTRRLVERTITLSGLVLKTKSEIIRESIPELSDKQFLTDLYLVQNLSMLEIATKLKTNEQVIKTSFKLLGIKSKSASKAKIDSKIKEVPQLGDKAFIAYQYLELKKSPKIIAKEIGCSSRSIETAILTYKIKKRSREESITRNTPQQNLNAKLARNLRTRFWIALKGKSKMASAVSDLGCSIDEFKLHIESFFHLHEDGREMSWKNYGRNGWEMDHHIPLSGFDLSIAEEQLKACNFNNIRPMWVKHNRIKSDSSPPGELPKRVKLFIVSGAAGSGKSWICDQLKDVNYISFDTIPKEQHYHYMVELSKNGRPIVYDPFRKANTIYNRYKHIFDAQIVTIVEDLDTIMSRLAQRGSNLDRSKVKKFVFKFKSSAKNSAFSGTSTEVLEYLRAQL